MVTMLDKTKHARAWKNAGRRIGEWTVIGPSRVKRYARTSEFFYLCRCSCGFERELSGIEFGKTKRCARCFDIASHGKPRKYPASIMEIAKRNGVSTTAVYYRIHKYGWADAQSGYKPRKVYDASKYAPKPRNRQAVSA